MDISGSSGEFCAESTAQLWLAANGIRDRDTNAEDAEFAEKNEERIPLWDGSLSL